MNIAKASLAAIALMSALILSAPAVRAQDDLAAVDPTLAATPAPAPRTVAPDAVLKVVQDKDSSVVVVDTQPAVGKGDYTSAQSSVGQLAVPSDRTEKPSTR